jgi:hypothetical protein
MHENQWFFYWHHNTCNRAKLPTTMSVMVPVRLQGKEPSKNTDENMMAEMIWEAISTVICASTTKLLRAQWMHYKKTTKLWLNFMTIKHHNCNVWLRMTSTILSENESVIVGHDDWRSIWSYRAVLIPHDAFPTGFGTSVRTPLWHFRFYDCMK